MNRTDFHDDEFDIELLAKKIARVTRKFFSSLFFPVRLILSKPYRLVAFLFAGVLAALGLFYTITPMYKASFLMKPVNKGDLYFMNLLMDVGNLINDHDYEGASYYLKLDENTCSKINRISVDLIRRNKYTDSADAANVYIATTDRSLFDTIQASLLHYLENTDYYQKIRLLRERDIEDMRTKLTNDINEIEELKKSLTASAPRNAGGFVYGEPVNPVIVYEEALSLYRQQMDLKWKANFVNNFQLVKGCIPSKKPASPKLPNLLLICTGVSLLLCFLYNYRKLRSIKV
jgi:hypothetical protein